MRLPEPISTPVDPALLLACCGAADERLDLHAAVAALDAELRLLRVTAPLDAPVVGMATPGVRGPTDEVAAHRLWSMRLASKPAPVPFYKTVCSQGAGLAVCLKLGVMVTSDKNYNLLSVFSLSPPAGSPAATPTVAASASFGAVESKEVRGRGTSSMLACGRVVLLGRWDSDAL